MNARRHNDKATAAQLVVLRLVAGGRLTGSGIGDGRLVTAMGGSARVAQRTFEALILRRWIAREPGSQLRESLVWTWMITERGRQELDRLRTRKP